MQKKHFAWLSGLLWVLWLGQVALLVHNVSSTGFTILAQGKILFLVMELVGFILVFWGIFKKPRKKK